jgi:hypothetical protein
VFYRFCSTGVLVRVLFPSRGGFNMTPVFDLNFILASAFTGICVAAIVMIIRGLVNEAENSDHDDDDFMRPME